MQRFPSTIAFDPLKDVTSQHVRQLRGMGANHRPEHRQRVDRVRSAVGRRERNLGRENSPELRFFPDIDHSRWLNSSPVMIGEAPVGSAGDGAMATFGIFASGGDGSQEASAETRWTLRGPQLVAIQLGDRTTPTFEIPEGATVFLEFRESDTLEGGYGSVLIFPSGFELIIHPDTIDSLLARTDITDPVANAVIESIRRELSGAQEQTTTVDFPCHVVTEPFSSATVELAETTCILARGAGTLTVRYSGYGALTLTLPVGHPEWLIGVAGTSWTDGATGAVCQPHSRTGPNFGHQFDDWRRRASGSQRQSRRSWMERAVRRYRCVSFELSRRCSHAVHRVVHPVDRRAQDASLACRHVSAAAARPGRPDWHRERSALLVMGAESDDDSAISSEHLPRDDETV